MKDRFKFRAWDKREGNYIEDAQFTYDDGCEGGGGSHRHYSFRDLLEDETCVVEQCTGLKDMKGKLIYEGDIIEIYKYYEKGRYRVVHDDSDNECYLVTAEDYYKFLLTEYHPDATEVIGNVHENPELLLSEEEIKREEVEEHIIPESPMKADTADKLKWLGELMRKKGENEDGLR